MEKNNHDIEVLLMLLKAGLWPQTANGVSDMISDSVDYGNVLKLAEEQAVVGLLLAGLESLSVEQRPPKSLLLQCIGEVQMIESQNCAMNTFIEKLFIMLQKEGMEPVLMKGQGIAQCYEKPLWRSSGDVDLLLNDEDYERCKAFLLPKATSLESEFAYHKHQGMIMNGWPIEIHGRIRGLLTDRADRVLDEMQKDIFKSNKEGSKLFRYWKNGNVEVPLMAATEDTVYVFSHVLHHFFGGGIGLRQICDWCRLMWTYREDIDVVVLETRLHKMGMMTEWLAFAMLAVEWLGMPPESIPLYKSERKWKKKAGRIMEYIMDMGNFGHNRDESYRKKYPYLIMKIVSMWRHTVDNLRLMRIFPVDAIKVWWMLLRTGIREL